jgi:predicted nucleic acid-binding protein
VEIGAREYTVAGEWLASYTTPLRAPDALHLAAAFVNRMPLLTADRTLAESAMYFGVKAILIN